MRYYELMYLVHPKLSEEEYRDTLGKYHGLIEKNRGVVIKTDEWGKKSLAYTIKKSDRAYYVLLLYCGDPEVPSILQKEMRMDDKVLKFQTIKLNDDADPEALKAEMEEGKPEELSETTQEGEEENGIPEE